MAPNWEKLRALDPNFDWQRLEVSYGLVCIPGLPWSAVRGLLAERVSAPRTATMSDLELLGVCGVGPVSVRRLRAAYPRQRARKRGGV
jgi:hypothetical protein